MQYFKIVLENEAKFIIILLNFNKIKFETVYLFESILDAKSKTINNMFFMYFKTELNSHV
jgi:hypothetical protein